jgi:hypothetical protein
VYPRFVRAPAADVRILVTGLVAMAAPSLLAAGGRQHPHGSTITLPPDAFDAGVS